MLCKNCKTLGNDMVLFNGQHFCKDCYYLMTVTCCKTGERVLREEAIYCQGEYYSKQAAERCLVICEDCGVYIKKDRALVIDGSTYCRGCQPDYIICHECGETIHIDDSRSTDIGEYICESCFEDNYFVCDECGEIFHRDEMCCDDTYCYCSNCYEDNCNIVMDYNEDVDFRKRTMPYEDTEELFGIELEVNAERSYAKTVDDIMCDDVVFKEDSSIIGDGFEIISHPMTRRYFYEKFMPNMEKALRFMINNGCYSHNRGGMHVHFSTESLLSTKALAQMAEVLYGNENDRNTWLEITQRTEGNINEWASMRNKTETFYAIHGNSDFNRLSSDRYTALNYDYDTDTLELRIFNGNLKKERFLKNMECVFALIDYSNEHNNNIRPVCNTTDFLEYVNQNKTRYPNLYEFIEEKEIKEMHNEKELEMEVA